MTPYDPTIQTTYDEMWQRAMEAFQRSELQIDPQLLDIKHDQRLGLGCIIRPVLATFPALPVLLDELAYLVPDQHYYRLEELHISVLTPIPSFVGFDLMAVPLGDYLEMFRTAVATHPPFALTFAGVTASPSAIMLQGFFPPGTLASLRTTLMAALEEAGLAACMDRRYPLRGAHMTLLRFSRPPGDLSSLRRRLTELRETPFGSSWVTEIRLVTADWYMSHTKVRTVACLPLGHAVGDNS
jgi:hypothetical protein